MTKETQTFDAEMIERLIIREVVNIQNRNTSVVHDPHVLRAAAETAVDARSVDVARMLTGIRKDASREELMFEIAELIDENARQYELLVEFYQEAEREDAYARADAQINEGEDDDPTCIECGWHRSEHGHQDHSFQRRLTDDEYAAEQQRFVMEADIENGSYPYDPDEDEADDDDLMGICKVCGKEGDIGSGYCDEHHVSNEDELTALLESLSAK